MTPELNIDQSLIGETVNNSQFVEIYRQALEKAGWPVPDSLDLHQLYYQDTELEAFSLHAEVIKSGLTDAYDFDGDFIQIWINAIRPNKIAVISRNAPVVIDIKLEGWEGEMAQALEKALENPGNFRSLEAEMDRRWSYNSWGTDNFWRKD